MSSDQFEHIQKIQNEFHEVSKVERVRDSLNNAIQLLAEGLYSKRPHFIFELIQNAEDNKYENRDSYQPYISFQLTKTDPTCTVGSDGALIIKNNEIGFNHDNVSAICAMGKTTKKKEQGYIGEKGIGFKSVFRVTDNPYILSNGYHFRLPESDEETGFGYIVPQWIDTPLEGLDLSETYIILPLTKRGFGYEDIEKMLQDIDPEVILFLSTLQEIQIKTDTGDDFTILKDDSAMPEVQIVAEGKKQGLAFSNSGGFLVCTGSFGKPADIHHEKRAGIENRDVTIGFPLDENSTAVRKIFAYLPVKTTDFPFLINADFILTSSREDIQDVPWNCCWLMECVADLIAKGLLPLLKERKLLNVDFLEALASKLNKLAEDGNDMFYPIFSRLCETFMNEELLPANDGAFVSAQNAVLTRSTAVRNLLTHEQLRMLFLPSDVESDSELKWISAEVTLDRTPSLRSYLMNSLGIDEVTPTMFASKLSLDFLLVRTDDWFVKFYKFLSGQPTLWNSEVSILRTKPILTKPILRLENGTHVNPPENKSSSYFYLSLDSETDSSLPIVKSSISQDKGALKFLKELGIPEWDIVAEVIERILPKYRDNSSTISRAEYNLDFSKIVNAYSTDSQKKKDLLQEALLTTPFILTESSHASDQIYLGPNQLYFGTDDGLWTDSSIGDYSRVSVSEEVCQFLKKLGIPQWDAVEEVIKTILPKYKQEPPTVSIKEHTNDFKKITLAYETDNQYKKMQLKTALQATHFILAENPSADFPIYLKPDHLYFAIDELRMYFEQNNLVYWSEIFKSNGDDVTDLLRDYESDSSEGPTTRAFVGLDEYPHAARTLFEDLKILDSVRIKRKEKNSQGYVTIVEQHSRHWRGLEGFDPDIQVDGLEHAIDNPTPEKSAFIWSHIALPNADCIRGRVQKSTTQNYGNSSFENVLSPYFGKLLVNKAWLPDIDGNMYKPSEITLTELPENFVRNERLANQLGMKKDELAELSDKIGVSEEDIKDFVENKKEYMEWKAEKVKQEQSSPPEPEESEPKTIPHQIDYHVEIEKYFNKSGKTEVQPHIIDDGRVNNPERRREKIAEEHRDRLNREPSADDRRRETYRTLLEGPDPQVREYLSQMYGGECQICDRTFPERDGKPFFVASYIVERQKSGGVDTPANALCLCADHFAKFKHGAIEAGDVPTQIENFQIESEGGDCKPILDIKLCGEKCKIHFKEKHLLDLQELIKVSNDD